MIFGFLVSHALKVVVCVVDLEEIVADSVLVLLVVAAAVVIVVVGIIIASENDVDYVDLFEFFVGDFGECSKHFEPY